MVILLLSNRNITDNTSRVNIGFQIRNTSASTVKFSLQMMRLPAHNTKTVYVTRETRNASFDLCTRMEKRRKERTKRREGK
jgi:hypothetical protein